MKGGEAVALNFKKWILEKLGKKASEQLQVILQCVKCLVYLLKSMSVNLHSGNASI